MFMYKTSTSKYTGAEKGALGVYTKLMKAAESVTARTSRAMTTAGLTVSQFGAGGFASG